ncbi:GntR family transcriptional regulator [Piscinibacter sp.]|uniref:GntR family transcriptional regulator n=1 Tax=Piscinibacter sp. TaxID=1903157 RepID=UPI0039E4C353
MPVDAEAPESLVEQAYLRIENDIARLELAPGQVVSENMLASRYEIGRTPIREALQQLAREGLVVILPKRGIVISEIDVRKQLRLLEVRRYMERCIVLLATRNANDTERAHFAAIASEMTVAGASENGEAFLALDGEFNQLVLAASRNEFAVASMKLTQGLSRRFWFAFYQKSADLNRAAQLHAAIADAIARKDESAAEKSLDQLLDNVKEFTLATLDSYHD